MYPWLKIPLIRAFIPFVVGILLYKSIPQIPDYYVYLFFCIPLCFVVFSRLYFSRTKQYFKFRWVDGLCFTIIFFVGGYLVTYSNDQLRSKNHFSHFLQKQSIVIAKIVQVPEEKLKTIKLEVKVVAVENSNVNIPVTGEMIVYVSKDSLAKCLRYADLIAIKNNVADIPAALNPGQFDYKSNLANRSIYQQALLKQNEWRFIGHGIPNRIMEAMFKVRSVFIKSVKANFIDDSQQAILLALLIGYTSEINDEIRQSFTETGIMHLLAVSGMHVGLIFMVLNFVFKGLTKIKYGNIVFIIAISLMLWIYAGITGFSPSVLRATVMFNFLLIGKNIRKVNFVYNSIMVSIFLLLLYDPRMIYHVGFQLSYAAVIGIVFVQPYLNSLLTSKSWVVKKLWPLISVTLSAQFFTLPLILYYFNQFPVYFFIANLLIIPISTFIIYIGFIVVLFDVLALHSLTLFFAFIEKYSIDLMNQIIFYIRQLPYVLINNIYLSPLMTLLLFLAILFLCFWVFYNRRRDLFYFGCSLILFIISITAWNFQNLKRNQLVIYAIPGKTLISLQEHKKGLYIGDSAIIYDNKKLRLNTFRNMISSGISFRNSPRFVIGSKITTSNFVADGKIISANSLRILYLDQSYKPYRLTEKIKVDIILLAHNPKVKFAHLKSTYDFKQVVFDGSNAPWKIKKWKLECAKLSIKYNDINENGAMIIDI